MKSPVLSVPCRSANGPGHRPGRLARPAETTATQAVWRCMTNTGQLSHGPHPWGQGTSRAGTFRCVHRLRENHGPGVRRSGLPDRFDEPSRDRVSRSRGRAASSPTPARRVHMKGSRCTRSRAEPSTAAATAASSAWTARSRTALLRGAESESRHRRGRFDRSVLSRRRVDCVDPFFEAAGLARHELRLS
jgi:hypothetical protein